MKKFVLACSFAALCFAHSALAAVVLNEIAWMGSSASSADEWVELYNDGVVPVDLTGWKITGKNSASIALLSGSIAPNGYFLIERSDDNTVPDVPADLVVSFGKGISNDGETLKLLDGGGNTVDTAVGGKNWTKLGGDKATKQTAQRTPSGWITAPATPRAPNKTPSLARETATPLSKAKTSRVVSIANAETLTEDNAQPASPAVSSRKAASAKDEHVSAQMISTSSVGANVLWQRGANADAEKRAWAWMIVAVLLVIVASLVIMRANVYEPTEADKYAIIEDIIEGKEDEDRLSDY